MITDKYDSAQRALERYEKLFGQEFLDVFSVVNGYIFEELTDGMVAGVPQRAALENKVLWVVPIVLAKKLVFMEKLAQSSSKTKRIRF